MKLDFVYKGYGKLYISKIATQLFYGGLDEVGSIGDCGSPRASSNLAGRPLFLYIGIENIRQNKEKCVCQCYKQGRDNFTNKVSYNEEID